MTEPLVEPAPAKINLSLFLGPLRDDGRHELVTLFDSLTLADELTVGPGDRDEVICAGVSGPNLVDAALEALRGAGWRAAPLRVQIEKRIPVAAGMGGGSADAAAMLRLAPRLAPVAGATLSRIAAGLGADVPSQLDPGPSIGTAAGEIVQPLPGLAPYGVLVLPQTFVLRTPDVYREADRLGLGRPTAELAALRRRLAAAAASELPAGLLVNDLQAAAISLAPAIDEALATAAGAGADHVLVCGSGPTVIGLFAGADGPERAARARERLHGRWPGALAAAPVGRGVSAPTPNE